MAFWSILYGVLWFLYCVGMYIKESQQKKILALSIFIVWFIGAFRLNIGTDYSTYAAWYSNGNFSEDFIEPTFYYLVVVMNYIGFKSQMLFLVYETITVFFLCKGLQYFSGDKFVYWTVFIIWVVYPTNGGHWWDMNAIRQATAISISFWSMKYLVQNNIMKFICGLLMAMMFHYTSILVGVMYLLKNKKIPFSFVGVLLIVGFISNGLGITANVAMNIIEVMTGLVGKYESALYLADAGTSAFSTMAVILTAIYYIANRMIRRDDISPVVYNGAVVYILLRVYMSFGVEDSILAFVVHRFETYFLFFYLLVIALAMRKMVLLQSNKYLAYIPVAIVIFGFSLMGLYSIYNYDMNVLAKLLGPSSGNINYEFNFKLL